MSQENVEIVRRWAWAAFNDQDVFAELTDPAIEWAPFEENHTVYHGLDGARQILAGWLGSWSDHDLEIEELVDAGEQGVVATAHLTARGSESGVDVDVRLYVRFRFRDGRVVYVFEHTDRDEALKAVGLAG